MEADVAVVSLFQSTHPVWGGTTEGDPWALAKANFNPPTPCGVGLVLVFVAIAIASISIHPPRVGWDSERFDFFLSTFISIHPPRVGWDLTRTSRFSVSL